MASSAIQPIKIEMALVDDLDKVYQSAINMQEKAEIMIVDYNSMASKIVGLLNQIGPEYLKANSILQEVEQIGRAHV